MSTPYVQFSDVEAKIPRRFLHEALDDDLDGQADPAIFDTIVGQIGNEIEGTLGQRYATPFTAPYPSIILDAALIFACEAIYGRRVAPEQNPWKSRADQIRTKLDAIAKGDQPLTPDLQRKDPSVSVISAPSKTFSHRTAV